MFLVCHLLSYIRVRIEKESKATRGFQHSQHGRKDIRHVEAVFEPIRPNESCDHSHISRTNENPSPRTRNERRPGLPSPHRRQVNPARLRMTEEKVPPECKTNLRREGSVFIVVAPYGATEEQFSRPGALFFLERERTSEGVLGQNPHVVRLRVAHGANVGSFERGNDDPSGG